MNVYWTRGTRMVGAKMQLGVAVLRPGWLAFLPLFEPVGGAEQFSMGMSGTFALGAFRMDVAWQGKYPMQAWWQSGEKAFDEWVARAASEQGGFVIARADGEIVRTKHATTFQTKDLPPSLAVTFPGGVPPHLAEGWAPGVAHFDAKKTALVFGIMSVVLVLFAGSCGGLAVVGPDPGIVFGALFWLFFVALAWILFFVRHAEWRRGMRAKEAARAPGPYR